MLADFQNSFTGRLSGKFATNIYLNIPSRFNYVATLSREIFMFKKSPCSRNYRIKLFCVGGGWNKHLASVCTPPRKKRRLDRLTRFRSRGRDQQTDRHYICSNVPRLASATMRSKKEVSMARSAALQ